MMNAVIYCRVANQPQGDNSRLDAQEKTCKDYAKQHAIKVIKTIKEVGSGIDLKRPGLQKAFALLNQGKALFIIVTD